jgi:glycosyltransferase involved in cell wall biosynthesis
MSCLYYSRRCGIHDEKFLVLLRKLGVPVHGVFIEKSDYRFDATGLLSYQVLSDLNEDAIGDNQIRADIFSRLVGKLQPDWIMAGPLWPCSFEALQMHIPVLSVSWAFDLIVDAKANQEISNGIKRVLCDSQSVFFDNPAIAEIASKLVTLNINNYVFCWGVDTNLFSPRTSIARKDSCDTKRVIHNRGLTEIYRPGFVLSGFLEARKKFDSLELSFLASPEGFLRFINGSRVGVEGNGLFQLDLQDNKRFADTLKMFDIYVTASSSDGTSISLLEAMACGLLVLVPNSKANLHVVGIETSNLQTYEENDLEDFSKKLINLSGLSSSHADMLRLQNRDRCVSAFSKGMFEEKFSEMIECFQSRFLS